MPQINQETLRAIQAWSAVATVAATALLVLLALWAGRRVGRQIGQADKQHAELRSLSVRPALSVRSATFSPDGVDIALENIGAGPALEVSLRAWPLPLGRYRPTLTEVNAALSDLEAIRDRGQPQLVAEVAGVPAGQPARGESLYYVTPGTVRDAETIGFGVLLWEASSEDVFGKPSCASGWTLIRPDE